MKDFRTAVLNPPGLPDPSLPIAACRAGALGILDLEYTDDTKVSLQSIIQLARHARQDFGVKLSADNTVLLAKLLSDLPKHLKVIALTSAEPQELNSVVEDLHRKNLEVLLESTCLREAHIGKHIGVDGLIAKGHEAGGRVGNETTFILVQKLLKFAGLPIWAQGGIGLHTAAAYYLVGAAGVVLDSQLALTRESPIPERLKAKIAAMDGSETECLGNEAGESYRFYAIRPLVKELREKEMILSSRGASQEEIAANWRQEIHRRLGWGSSEHNLYLLGQDLAFAGTLAKRYVTVGGVIDAIVKTMDANYQAVSKPYPFHEGSPMAESHGTRYPIVQGPMAQVSDIPAFAQRVAEEGALPFIALSWLSAGDLQNLFKETSDLLGDKPWGVGILGFLPPELYNEQVKAVTSFHPPFAMISGGRPDQVKKLEEEGIKTYLHAPSPGLLRMFLDIGIRRLVLEGRESGGHVGPLSSFVLWELTNQILLEHLSSTTQPDEYHVLFAGGIHDALSASMVAAIAAPLAMKGIRVGVQIGSAYLFTEEAVATGAILAAYQEQIINCGETVVLDAGLGHANRCALTPFTDVFNEKKRELVLYQKPYDEIRETLENLCSGRLRIASKGRFAKIIPGQESQNLESFPMTKDEQHLHGLYLIGQCAALHSQTYTMNSLHHEVSLGSSKILESVQGKEPELLAPSKARGPSDVAIIGMACLLPKAPNLETYWENILNKINAVTLVPKERWNWESYYDKEKTTKDKVYSKWGAFIDDTSFDPMRYGLPPKSLSSIDPQQLLALEVVRAALEDGGYWNRPFARERTSVIFGISGQAELGQLYTFRSALPMFFGSASEDIYSHFEGFLPEWTEDSFPGILVNVTAGRIANRFNLGGMNLTVDAACASSLAAVYLAVRDLENYCSDMVIVGGADTMQNPFTYLCFSKTHALSPNGVLRCLDERADGVVLGEGIAAMILKRLADAERDGDRIYAVIKGVGAGSDGRDRSLTAPGKNGQVRTLKRAYEQANISPATIGLLEAHSTGTTVGDRVEIEAASQIWGDAGARSRCCAIGSVKSMIGHTKSAAGIASLVKTALALYHKVLPPTLGVEMPNAAIRSPECPFYVNTEARPWIHHAEEHPRRAGTSAFGFGGTNYHVVLEEYTEAFLHGDRPAPHQNWPSELLIWNGRSRQEIMEAIRPIEEALSHGANPALRNLAYSINLLNERSISGEDRSGLQLALVADSLQDLKQKLEWARAALSGSDPGIHDPRGIYFSERPLGREGKIAFLFPGQGAHYVNMLSELAIAFPEIRELFERGDDILRNKFAEPLTRFIFPLPAFTEKEKLAYKRALAQTNIAQPAIGTASLALFHLLEALGVFPDMVAGHSYGEYVALSVAGVLSEDDLILLSEARGRFIVEAAEPEQGTMAAINAGENVREMIADIEGVVVANLNAPKQTIISGTRSAVNESLKRFKKAGINTALIPVACAFHSPIVSKAGEPLKAFLSEISLGVPKLKVFSNRTAAPYPTGPDAIPEELAQHLSSPIDFIGEIEAMYEDGARVFIEVGPGRILSGLVGQILKDRAHLAITSCQGGRSELVQLHHLLGQLAAHGVPIKMDRLHKGRSLKRIDLNSIDGQHPRADLPSTTWLVNGFRARPLKELSSTNSDGMVKPIHISLGKERPAAGPVASKKENAGQPVPPSLPKETNTMSPPAEARPQGCPSVSRPFSEDGNSQVIIQYQRLMQRFLETQKNVMLSYMRGTSFSGLPGQSVQRSLAKQTEPASLPEESQDEGTAGVAQATETAEFPSATLQPGRGVNLPEGNFESYLLEIVSDRTGYPKEMLDLDVDLEAELGIDSIKRIEILGSLMQGVDASTRQRMEKEMESLTGIKNLRGIMRWLDECADSEARPVPRGEPCESSLSGSQEHAEPSPSGERTVQRYISSVVPAPPCRPSLPLHSDGVVMITDDERGIARTLVSTLKERGQAVALASLSDDFQEGEDGRYKAPLDSPEGASRLLEIIRQRHGFIGGLIHLLPLRNGTPFDAMDFSNWKKLLQVEVKSLFYLIKGMVEHAAETARRGSNFVIAASGMGGRFASDREETKGNFFAGQGGIGGLLKTLTLEWPNVSVKAIDLNPKENVTDLANHLMTEMTLGDQRVEIGFDDSERLALEAVLSPLHRQGPKALNIDSSWVLLVTGGARGITANAALELAKCYQPTLILAGRSTLPSPEEPPETVGLNTAKEIKAALISQMRKESKPVLLPQVEAAYQRLLKEREIRRNLADMQNAGAKVQYFQCDVRDEKAFGDLIDEVYRTYGRLDGVIHGAGIIEDKLVKDKTAESFDRVFDTKVDSAFILSRRLRPESLKFLVFFTSVAGRFGNRGQGDYAAANEVLNKLAVYLDRRWPGRVVSINWGPWAKSGMVTSELQKQFAHRGIELIPPSVGAQKLDQELSYGKKGEVEITVGQVDGWERQR